MPYASAGYVAQVQYYWNKEAIAQINQAPPVQNTWYTVLDTKVDVRLIWLVLRQDNDETDNKNLEIRVTMDGVALIGTIDAVNLTYYQAYLNLSADTLIVSGTKFNSGYYVDIRGRSVKVEIRITSVVGTNQVLRGRVQHEQHVVT